MWHIKLVHLSFLTQIHFLFTLIASDKIPDKDLEKRRCEQRVDPLTDVLYTKSEYAPEAPTKDEKDMDDEEEEEEEEEVEEEMVEEEEEVS